MMVESYLKHTLTAYSGFTMQGGHPKFWSAGPNDDLHTATWSAHVEIGIEPCVLQTNIMEVLIEPCVLQIIISCVLQTVTV